MSVAIIIAFGGHLGDLRERDAFRLEAHLSLSALSSIQSHSRRVLVAALSLICCLDDVASRLVLFSVPVVNMRVGDRHRRRVPEDWPLNI